MIRAVSPVMFHQKWALSITPIVIFNGLTSKCAIRLSSVAYRPARKLLLLNVFETCLNRIRKNSTRLA